MIELTKIWRSFGDITAVRDVSFSVQRAEVLGLLGPNGAGKSTTMRMIAGVLAPDSGHITLGGHDVGQAPLVALAQLGFLPEGAPAWPDMTVWQFLRFCARVRRLHGKAADMALARACALTKLHDVLAQRIDTLSKGYQRRVGLAQAILHSPPALIMDEPTDGLDPNQKHDIRHAIADMAHSTAIIISTHILEEVDAVCTRALIIDKGRIVCDESPGALAARSRYAGAVRLTLRRPQARKARPLLEALSGVAAVEEMAQGADVALVICPQKMGKDLLAQVHDACAQHGWKPQSLFLERGRLDDVFRTLTSSEHTSSEQVGATHP